jgi:hypothetical protein
MKLSVAASARIMELSVNLLNFHAEFISEIRCGWGSADYGPLAAFCHRGTGGEVSMMRFRIQCNSMNTLTGTIAADENESKA